MTVQRNFVDMICLRCPSELSLFRIEFPPPDFSHTASGFQERFACCYAGLSHLPFCDLPLESGVLLLKFFLQMLEPQMCLYAGCNLFTLKGFGNIVYSTGGKGLHFVRCFIEDGEEYNRDIASAVVIFEVLTDLVPVHIGHSDVQEDQIGWNGTSRP